MAQPSDRSPRAPGEQHEDRHAGLIRRRGLGALGASGAIAAALAPLLRPTVTRAQGASAAGSGPQGPKWLASWAASAHGPYPSGNPSAQPDLSFVFPDATAGARDQTFRLMVKPSLWGQAVRLRFSNAFGTRPVTLDGVHVGVQETRAVLLAGSNQAVTFRGGRGAVTIQPGRTVYSDPVRLDYVRGATDPLVGGRRLAVSFHAAGPTGPMTWHAKALTTSYVTPPGGGSPGGEEGDDAFPFTTTSWYFLDAVEVAVPADAFCVVALGDSITDGTNSTLNGDDRWPDYVATRLRAVFDGKAALVNAGIGGNRVVGPEEYTPEQPVPGGPAALERLDRDVLSLAGVTTVIWMEGINDLGAGTPAADVIAGLRSGVERMHARGLRVIGATLTTALNSTVVTHGTPEVDARRRQINEFIRAGGIFDGVADFDAAVLDPSTGELRPEFVFNTTVGGAGDKLHPNRAGYQAMAAAVDVASLTPSR